MPDRDWRPKFHIQPPIGWLNDPNGSCCFGGKYHIYFQYSPDNPNGGDKYWGHYESSDLAHFQFIGSPLAPDKPFDKNGVYSGTAWDENGTLELYYTGNVKHKGDYDYINEGRGHNVIRVKTTDNRNYTEKELLLENKDYPSNLSCHVRDPKIFKVGDYYYMLLGARTRDSKGGLLFMKSKDRDNWETDCLFLPSGFGYMLECPDFFSLDRKNGKTGVISFCPQGIESEEFKYQNIYQSGYCLLSDDLVRDDKVSSDVLGKNITLSNFTEWDMGFDFYAPQVFEAMDKRKLIIGWAGLPDALYKNSKTVEKGWQHCMTLIRELTLSNGKIHQMPVKELEALRNKKIVDENFEAGGKAVLRGAAWDTKIEFSGDCELEIRLNEDLTLYEEDGNVRLKFLNNSGDGRDVRSIKNTKIKNARMIFDESILEIYLNDGEYVLTTRYYPEENLAMNLTINGRDSKVESYSMTEGIKY
ncbi:MAG: glycoside hydrolase family 32 protein [Lachnospiraceae bacterium]|nr:glycoside hydrolase family 32 protein [Lachnospiraceae bacterium]